MKNSLSLGLILSGLLLLNVVAFAQDPDLTAEEVLKNTVAASSNMHGCDFPRLDKENRAYFRLYSPDVKRLQIDICGKKYEMNKDENGWWTVKTDPLVVGFHYYFLLVDGFSVIDPMSCTFFGCSRMAAALKCPKEKRVIIIVCRMCLMGKCVPALTMPKASSVSVVA